MPDQQVAVKVFIAGMEFSASNVNITYAGGGREGGATFNVAWAIRYTQQNVVICDASNFDEAYLPETKGISQVKVRNWQKVEIYNIEATRIFQGFVRNISTTVVANNLVEAAITCVDGTVLLDGILGDNDFWGQNDNSIISWILQRGSSALQPGTLHFLQTLEFFDTNDVTLKEVIRRLMEVTGAEMYVSPDFELNYIHPASLPLAGTFSNDPADIDFHTGGEVYPFKSMAFSEETALPITQVTVKGAIDEGSGSQFKATATDTAEARAIYGLNRKVVQANEIRSNADALLYANIELAKYKDARTTGKIVTFSKTTPLWSVGSRIRIVSPDRQFDEIVQLRGAQLSEFTPDGTYTITYDFGPYKPTLDSLLLELARRQKSTSAWSNPKVQTTTVGAGAVGELQLADRAVTAVKVALGAIQEELIATNAITETKISTDAITSPKIAAAAITSAKLDVGSVTANAVAADAITGVKILAGSITALDAVFASGAIQSADIGTAQITEAKIGNLAVTTLKIGDTAITEAKLQDLAVSGSKMANATITTAKIGTAQITTALIADAQITKAKIVSISAEDIEAGTISVAISLTSPTITSTSAEGTVTITGGYLQSEYTTLRCRVSTGLVESRSMASSLSCAVNYTGVTGINQNGFIAFNLSNNTSDGGQLNVNSNFGATRIQLNWSNGITVNGTVFCDLSRNVNANSYAIGGTSVVDSSRNIAGVSLSINGTSVIDSSRNASFTSLTINGTTAINSSRNLDVTQMTLRGQWRTDQSVASGSPGAAAVAKIPVYPIGGGSEIGYVYLYP